MKHSKISDPLKTLSLLLGLYVCVNESEEKTVRLQVCLADISWTFYLILYVCVEMDVLLVQGMHTARFYLNLFQKRPAHRKISVSMLHLEMWPEWKNISDQFIWKIL